MPFIKTNKGKVTEVGRFKKKGDKDVEMVPILKFCKKCGKKLAKPEFKKGICKKCVKKHG
jgi:hypothetical protein